MTAPIVGSIAGNVLRSFRVEIDYAHGVTYFKQERMLPDSDQDSVGLVLVANKSGELVVSGVSSSAADDVKLSVKSGDVLVAVNGVSQVGHSLAQAAVDLKGAVGSTKKLTIQRGGKVFDVKVTVKKLL